MSTKAKQNFTEGGLFFKILLFSLPIMATNLLQMLYNSADNIVVGQFSGDPEALAAIGCTGALVNIILNALIGTSSGAGVVCAQFLGAGRRDGVSRTTHTAMTVSVIGGILFMLVGLLVHRPILSLIVNEKSILDKAALYVFIICFGIPAQAVMNFGVAILRSIGNSRTPFIILISSGLLNVILNLVFVIFCNMSIAGVALATIAAHYASATAVVIILLRAKGEAHHLEFKKLGIDIGIFKRMLFIGIPAALQSSAYSISNIFIVAGINTFDRPYISANTIAGNLDNMLYVCMVTFTQSAMTAAGQNYGAGKADRVKKTLLYTLAQSIAVGIVVSTTVFLLKEPIIKLYVEASDPLFDEVVAATVRWVSFFIFPYIICGVFEVLAGFLRGIGNSTPPMLIVLFCCCLTRIIWVSAIFPNLPHEIESLIWCYPISWTLSVIVALFVLIRSLKRLRKTLGGTDTKNASESAV